MLTPDLEKYRKHVAGINLPQSRKDDMIRIVFRIMQHFVDRAFGVNPAQQKQLPSPENSSEMAGDHVSLSAPLQTETRKPPTTITGGRMRIPEVIP
jgi:hypothetical protein